MSLYLMHGPLPTLFCGVVARSLRVHFSSDLRGSIVECEMEVKKQRNRDLKTSEKVNVYMSSGVARWMWL